MAATQLVLTACGIIRNKVLARSLDTHLFGAFSQVTSALNFFHLSAQVGLGLSLNRNIAATEDRNERQDLLACANFLTLLTSALAIATVVTMVVLGLAGPVFGLGGEPQLLWVLVVIVAACPFETWRVNLFSVLQGILDVKGMSRERAAMVAAVTLTSVPLVFYFGIHGAVAQIALLSIAVGAMHARRLAQLGFQPMRAVFQRPVARKLLRYGVAGLLMDLSLNATDVFIRAAMAHRLGYSDVGFYQVAFSLSVNVKLVVLSSLGSIAIADLNATLDRETMFRRSSQILRTVLPITNLALGGLILASPILVPLLYTGEYLPATSLVGAIAVGDYMQTLNRVLGAPMLAQGRVRLWLGIGVVYVAVRILVTFSLMPWLHLFAVPVGYAVGMSCVTSLYYIVYRRVCRLELSRQTGLRMVGGVLAIAATASLFDGQSVLSRCLAAAVVAAVFVWDFVELGFAARLRARFSGQKGA
ncbi:MAG TPA: oligosaccharide flippase family protein [Haliangium sp.]|nr:oligosaccharide flippase family protein [Haliangium sp.]